MAKVSLKHIYKVYDGKVKAVSDFNLEIEDKQFIVFVGPSGCGKSTTLRMVAGLEEITAGELWIGDKLCNGVEPKNRNIAMVFQNYALFPNMTVYDNMAFGLRMHKVKKDEIDRRVRSAAEILGITEYLDRKPKALSGGQRQRVALGRAIVREPNVFLFDEPLSNLDAKLRAKMRTEITRLHKRLNTTFIYVTHDQVEAMTMGDRIVVMKGGLIQQADTPQNLFRWPANKFVAGFIGTPQMNFFNALLTRRQDGGLDVRTEGFSLTLTAEEACRIDGAYTHGDRTVIMGIRPDDIRPCAAAQPGKGFSAQVALVEELGTQTLIYANTNENQLMTEDSPTAFCSAAGEGTGISPGSIQQFSVDTSKLHFFDEQTELTIKHRMPVTYAHCTVKEGKLSILGSTVPLPEALRARLADGTYQARIPEGALCVADKGCNGIVAEADCTGKDEYICRIACGNEWVFLKHTGKCEKGDAICFTVRLDMVDWLDGADVVVKGMEQTFRLEGKFVRSGKFRSREHYIELGGCRIQTPFEFNQRMYDCGRTIFKRNLAFEGDENSIKITPEGTQAQVVELLDYGEAKYIRLKLGNQELCVKTVEDVRPGSVTVTVDVGTLKVYDRALDMLLF